MCIPKANTDVEMGTASDSSVLAFKTNNSSVSQEWLSAEISPKRMLLIVFSLCLLMFVCTLEMTVLSAVYIKIASHYQDLSSGIWIIKSYLLSSTTAQPLLGKFSDTLGRFETTVGATTILCVGSVFSAVSHSILMLIVSHAVQGIGGGGIMVMESVSMADVIYDRIRGKYAGIIRLD